jgi:hypothetical protein
MTLQAALRPITYLPGPSTTSRGPQRRQNWKPGSGESPLSRLPTPAICSCLNSARASRRASAQDSAQPTRRPYVPERRSMSWNAALARRRQRVVLLVEFPASSAAPLQNSSALRVERTGQMPAASRRHQGVGRLTRRRKHAAVGAESHARGPARIGHVRVPRNLTCPAATFPRARPGGSGPLADPANSMGPRSAAPDAQPTGGTRCGTLGWLLL